MVQLIFGGNNMRKFIQTGKKVSWKNLEELIEKINHCQRTLGCTSYPKFKMVNSDVSGWCP